MLLGKLSEIVWSTYYDGRVKATNQSVDKATVMQHLKMAFSNDMRQLYYANKKLNEGDEFYFTSPVLSVKRFVLSDLVNEQYRRADMSNVDLFRMPKNSHFTNFYPVGCGTNNLDITQVQPSEENFYMSPDFKNYIFCVAKGRGLNFYHLPACVKSIDIEATYDAEESTDISLDVAFDISNQVLGLILKVPGFGNKVIDNNYTAPQLEYRQKKLTQEPI